MQRPTDAEAVRRLDEYSKSVLGAPYRWGGRTPAEGLDCVGVVLGAFKACGVAVREPISEVGPDEERARDAFTAPLWRHLRPLPPGERPRPLDVVCISSVSGQSLHVAVVVSGSHALHTDAKVGAHLVKLRRLLGRPGVKLYRYAG